MPTLNDRYDLPLGTTSAAAAAAYGEGLDMVLAVRVEAEGCFARAIAEDDGFALAHAALAMEANADDEKDQANFSKVDTNSGAELPLGRGLRFPPFPDGVPSETRSKSSSRRSTSTLTTLIRTGAPRR